MSHLELRSADAATSDSHPGPGPKKVVVESSVRADGVECARGRAVAVRLPASMAGQGEQERVER